MEYQSQTEDSSSGMCNGSLGREILHTVQRNEAEQQQQQQQHGKKVSSGRRNQSQQEILKTFFQVRYAERDDYYSQDSSLNSSAVSVGIDDYLDEALGGEDEESEDDPNASHLSLGVSIPRILFLQRKTKVASLIAYRAKAPLPPIASPSARPQWPSAPSRSSMRPWTCRRRC